MRLVNKTIIVTGAARGLGRACAQQFSANGANLVLLDVAQNIPGVPYNLGSESQLQHTAQLCRQHGSIVTTMNVDIRDARQVNEAIYEAVKRFGRIDVLLNNAGVVSPSGKILHDTSEGDWQLMLDINLTGAWRLMKAAGKFMVEQQQGSIINIASTAGIVGYRYFAGYVASKHGVIGLTKAAALDYAPSKVRVNAISPGSVRDSQSEEGEMLAEIARSLQIDSTEYESSFIESQPMNALVEPIDIANAAVWLASDESVRVTGSNITVDAGFSIR
ncbi:MULTISPECIES: SDR family oxidoreductase [unclassified Pseudoalteromonas]|uniref:SDR family oxidoreductase n=1 Tax=unclassified Pseudoalteromonas TaxID=194690 RepID=UPI00046332F2|nr:MULTISPECIES: SDR family oxidoreductase [unclassified Pseudoalteromonas]PCC14210.1 oxidoreductase [Pseudoalteromonas sp. JB197]SJN16436.1 short-chain dehydrogenase/reductase SDR [Pseudoalteromonas sp. JB197]